MKFTFNLDAAETLNAVLGSLFLGYYLLLFCQLTRQANSQGIEKDWCKFLFVLPVYIHRAQDLYLTSIWRNQGLLYLIVKAFQQDGNNKKNRKFFRMHLKRTTQDFNSNTFWCYCLKKKGEITIPLQKRLRH